MKKRSKGFTLVELLAVIVVLAIIMVIATQQITTVIKKNTVNSFQSSLDMVTKQAKSAYLQKTSGIAATDVEELVDYDNTQYTISINGDNVCITSVDGGKFDDMDVSYFEEKYNANKAEDKQTTICKAYK